MQVAFLPPTSAAPLPGAATPAPTQPEPGADDASFAALLDSSAGQSAGEDGIPTSKPGGRATPGGDTPAEEVDIADLGLLAGLCPPMPMSAPVPTLLSAGATAGVPVEASVADSGVPTGEVVADGRTAVPELGQAAPEAPLARALPSNPKPREAAVPAQSPMINDAPGGTSRAIAPVPGMLPAHAAGGRAVSEAQPGKPFVPEAVSVSPGDSAANAPAGPVVATRTLTQVLCEVARPTGGTAVANPAPSSTDTATPSAQAVPMPGTSDAAGFPVADDGAGLMERPGGSVSATGRGAVETTTATAARAVAGVAEVAPQVEAPAGTGPVAKPSGLARTAPESLEKTGSAAEGDVATRVSRENPAARRTHGVAGEAGTTGHNGQRNFLNVGRQRVGESAPQFGTDVAKEAQPMPANATDLPPATHALSSDEPVVATVGALAESSATGTTRAAAESGPVRSVAAETIRQLQEVAARARETGRNQVDFQVRTSDDESLRVNLRWHDGVVHARFVSESAELQQALSREWALAAPRLAEKGLKFDQPSFEHHERSDHQSSAQDGFSFAQQRHSSRGQERTFELAGAAGRPSTAAPAAARPSTFHSSGTPSPERTAPLSRPATGVTNLRAWA